MNVEENLELQVRRLDLCGFYQRGVRKPDAMAVADLLPALANWSQGFTYWVDTKIGAGAGGGTAGTVYLLDIAKRNADYVLAMWIEGDHHEGKTLSMRTDLPVGKVRPDESELKANHLPGQPAYFWLLPDQGIVAAVRMRSRSAALGPWVRYMKQYLSHYSPHGLGIGTTASGKQKFTYQPDPTIDAFNVLPRFALGPAPDADRLEYILGRAGSITSIERRVDIMGTHVDRSPLRAQLMQALGISDDRAAKKKDDVMRVGFKLGYKPTLTEVRSIAKDVMAADDPWENVGFWFKGETSPFWLRGVTRAEKLSVKLPETRGGCYLAADVLDAVQFHRPTLVLRHGPNRKKGAQ
jgi:hypothetical protein